MKKLTWVFITVSLLGLSACHSDKERISLFPIEHYSQQLSDWIKPDDVNYNKPLMDASLQKKRFESFYNHYYGDYSPWNSDYVNHLLKAPAEDNVKALEANLIEMFNNKDKPDNQIGYGENFRPHTADWINAIAANINFSQLTNLNYTSDNQAIVIDNLQARALPTDDVHFFNHQLAGQGYPFDNLQISALWAGTPVYILGQTRDHAWTMVLTTDFIGWVKTNGIARVNAGFINAWKTAAKNQLTAITHTQTSIVDEQGTYRFLAYVGSLFPSMTTQDGFKIMIPVADSQHNAVISYANVSAQDAIKMPAPITPHNISNIMKTLIGRPYGWGNMYFYNDCSAELKNLFTAFGIWLPRHSSDQVRMGKLVDMTAKSPEQRLSYLMENGQRYLTLIYIGGHVVLYIGNYPDPHKKDHSLMAMTYQDIWGLHPEPSNSRAVIGQSVLFPMLLQYPEDTSLSSLASRKYFQVSFLNEPFNYLNIIQQVDLKSLMYP
jgi:cell wall-associated NlpC family hydrolase